VSKNKLIGTVAVALVGIILLFSTVGVNNNGYRQVVQWPTGYTYVKFTPGIYFKMFGSNEQYPDEMTFDYDDGESGGTLVENGIKVRYQDGGTGTTFGKLRLKLPTDEKTMLDLHRSVRSAEGFANRIIRPTVKEAHQMTAGLMSSEAAYAEKRGTYIEWVDSQLLKGKFVTELVKTEVKDEAGETVVKMVPQIKRDSETGEPLHSNSVLAGYGITIGSSPITNWDFEGKTLAQISAKREATMAIITAKANAERAKQDAITAEQQGLANVQVAKYEKEVIKVQAVVDAERAKEVAVIAAVQLVEVAAQTKLQQKELKLAAKETKQQQIFLGEGESERKRMNMEADGALQVKIDAWKEATIAGYKEFGKQKWVSEITMGTGTGGTGTGGTGIQSSAATDLMNLMMINNAKQISLDMNMKSGK